LHNRLSHLHIVWLNGEVVPTALQARFFAQLPKVKLLNDYSISECHDVCTHDLAELNPALSPKYAPLGLPMSNVRIYLLDEQLRPVPQGLTAEIYVGGDSIARGYLNQPEKTAERFILDPLRQDESRLFRTGDLGMILPNGHLEVKGRVEFMIKLRGYSIVLGAVETAIIEHPEVNTAVVLTCDNPETDQPESLIAYIVQNNNIDEATLVKELRVHLKERLPHYAIPATFITIAELPLHDVTGKLDRKKLPSPPKAKIKVSPPGRKSTLEQTILDIWEEILQLKAVHSDDNFFDLGGHSLLAIRMSESLSERLGVEFSVVDTYEYPTVKALVKFLAPKTTERQRNLLTQAHIAEPKEHTTQSTDIAIIGMACRFPGANDVGQFWDNLQQGVCSIRELPEEELAAKGIESSVIRNSDYRKIGALLDSVELFEPGFWGISKKEATLMDPQQRLFLESCYHAMEDAGYAPGSNGERTGVFGGCYSPTYLLYYLHGGGMTDPTDPGEFHLTETGNDKDYIATRVSYLLNLRGPSITVQTSCSTAAAVVATACQSLIARQCNMAIAGASSITFPQGGYQYVEGHINSHDGAVRAFDAASSGTILGDGVGAIVLKRLDDAIEAGDSITAVIKGFSINNDGNAKAGYSAPSVQGQKEMIQLAQEMAGVTADTISLVEAHGTGTLIGDPIEVRALTEVFRRTTAQKGFCALGSVKPNIGHSNIAAGMAGLIKTALCLKHKKLVPLINFSTPNPALNIEKSPFYINTKLHEWAPPHQAPRRAGVTCLGIGGTNCHFILEESPVLPTPDIDESSYQLLTLSAKSEKSLELSRLNLIDYLSRYPETNLGDLAYTLHVGRDAFRNRLAVACPDTDIASKKLKTAKIGKTFEDPAKLVFMFPGQGSQHPKMGYGLYQQVPAFRRYFDQCAELFQPLIDTDLRSLVFAESGSPAAQQAFSFAYFLQPAIFSLQYSLAKTLMEWGILPGALIGHSIGEYTAACIAGIMTLEDTIKLIAARSFAMEEAPEGAMLSVNMTKEEAETYIGTNDMLSLAVINSAKDMVLSGPVNSVSLAEKELIQSGTICRRVHVTRAFHSPMMNDAAEKLTSTIDEISFSPPQ
ncbi:MAG: acyltransferase domain-containing protein, partial [bacterium]|nr:acyltransferase domain-containing protein [bacterium]